MQRMKTYLETMQDTVPVNPTYLTMSNKYKEMLRNVYHRIGALGVRLDYAMNCYEQLQDFGMCIS